jgi:putative lipoprotein
VLLVAGGARAEDAWWAFDKGEHLIATTSIASVGTEVTRFWIASPWIRAAVGFGAAVVIGAGKELLDLTGLGDPSWKDFAWDLIGGAVGTVLSLGFEWLLSTLLPLGEGAR